MNSSSASISELPPQLTTPLKYYIVWLEDAGEVKHIVKKYHIYDKLIDTNG